MRDWNDLRLFVAVGCSRGFAAAERELGTPRSTFCRRISALEERLDVRLIDRSTRRFSVTDIGLQYFERYRAMAIEARAAQEAIDHTKAKPLGDD
ncbi:MULTISPECIES: LysR family transcriptional regulator [unclassified Rhizobium]|uniref:LysR family transcriptional regulator n=1 Tax=unclassified Rhizobium TaxID=2613769 RepID=UPI00161AE523|nr:MULTISPECIES: LysR family transcriptional regulator [unclassified Rhizobium]MBB3399407.1 DNA-binding transcriptional LysR family regulator [Rhizobium sp. BK060]MBB4169733.1 DNA-binding transcriptional LysR family regulator [Rhizobium sp. BK538]